MRPATELFVDLAKDSHREARKMSDPIDKRMKQWLLGRRSAFLQAARFIKRDYIWMNIDKEGR